MVFTAHISSQHPPNSIQKLRGINEQQSVSPHQHVAHDDNNISPIPTNA